MGGIINFSLGQLWARGAVGSALEWHSRGQGFESPRVHHRFRIRNRLVPVLTLNPRGLFDINFDTLFDINRVVPKVSGSARASPFLTSVASTKPSHIPPR